MQCDGQISLGFSSQLDESEFSALDIPWRQDSVPTPRAQDQSQTRREFGGQRQPKVQTYVSTTTAKISNGAPAKRQ